MVESGDELAGSEDEHVNKIKLKAWRGPDFIEDPETDYAGVGWILAENWWPYQRPTFVTPPFAGYVSGHSTYSRAAARVLSEFTGDEYFPGGIGEFEAPQNEFLVFEEGPSQDITLQWAKYYDASDQCSLSRIWGGIHPPVDDIPGRLIGDQVGIEAFELAEKYFTGTVVLSEQPLADDHLSVYPNPVIGDGYLEIKSANRIDKIEMYDLNGTLIMATESNPTSTLIRTTNIKPGIYVLKVNTDQLLFSRKIVIR